VPPDPLSVGSAKGGLIEPTESEVDVGMAAAQEGVRVALNDDHGLSLSARTSLPLPPASVVLAVTHGARVCVPRAWPWPG